MGNCKESDHIQGSHPPKNLLRGKERERGRKYCTKATIWFIHL